MKVIQNNKKAFFDYEILEKFEAGIVLKGLEVKSLREGKCNLKGSFCKFAKDELFSFGIHIGKYEKSSLWEKEIEEKRDRKLLLHRKQLNKLFEKVNIDGLTIVPLSIYFNDKNKVKIEIGLCKGQKNYDKRETLKKKTMEMETKKAIKDFK